jgi:protein ImuB
MLKYRQPAGKPQLQLFAGIDSTHSGSGAVAAAGDPDIAVRGTTARRSTAVWLCIYFPELCLEALGSPKKLPAAVFVERNGLATVYACNARARDAGVAPGMSLYAAMALKPELDIRQYQEHAQVDMLRASANWALAYTSVVSIDSSGALLLEIGASLRLFGGFDALRQRLAEDLKRCGHTVVMSSAPVAKAALWLARSGQETACPTVHDLPARLGRLPLAVLNWPVTVQQKLLQMGVRTLGDSMRLPRDGFARRVGPGYLGELDQAFGRSPELLHHYQPPEVFREAIELDTESLALDEISSVLHELLARLSLLLVRRQAAAGCLQLELSHHGRHPTVVEIATREPCASLRHFIELLQLRLEREVLPAPVIAVSLRAALLPGGQQRNADFWGSEIMHVCANPAKQAVLQRSRVIRLVERLRARLGPGCVHGLNLVAEHRPEYAWCSAEPYSPASCQKMLSELISRIRPLWLLARPRRLDMVQGMPVYRGKLVFVSNAERIESGWWDGNDVRRDYYRVADEHGKRLWVYQDRRSAGWYLHGLFA